MNFLYRNEIVYFPDKLSKENNIYFHRKTFYELKMLEYISSLYLKGTYIDVGSHIGNHLIYFSKFCLAEQVLGFEPLFHFYNIAQKSIVINNISEKCQLYNYGLSHSEFNSEFNFQNISEVVSFRPLDSLLNILSSVSLLKIDAEGHEESVIAGAYETIKHFKPLIFAESHSERQYHQLLNILSSIGYEPTGNVFNATPTYEFRPVNNYYKKYYDVKQYWESRYSSKGSSSAGSFGRLALFKSYILNKFVTDNSIKSVAELGCGDGQQLSLSNYPNYIGFDINETAILICTEKFYHDKTKKFIHFKDDLDPSSYKSDMSLSLDVIYHLFDDTIYFNYLNFLFSLSERYVIIYSNNTTFYNKGTNKNASYIKFRYFLEDVENLFPEWKLISAIPNQYPYNTSLPSESSFSDFYIFKKDSNTTYCDFLNFNIVKIFNQTSMLSEQIDHVSNFLSSKLSEHQDSIKFSFSDNKSLLAENKSLLADNKSLLAENKSLLAEKKSCSSKINSLNINLESLNLLNSKLVLKLNLLSRLPKPARIKKLKKQVSILKNSNLLDIDFYYKTYPDVASLNIDPYLHFINVGWRELRNPNKYFNTYYYLTTNSDVLNSSINPIIHFYQFGWREGRNPSNNFDVNFYLHYYPDVAVSGMNPLTHFLLYGYTEGRLPKNKRTEKNINTDESLQDQLNFFQKNKLAEWLKNFNSKEEFFFIVYADINLNIVDGSSVWMSSVLSLISTFGRAILISKSNLKSSVITDNISNFQNITILKPESIDFNKDFTPTSCIDILREIDNFFPSIRYILVRGLEVASLLHDTRQFKFRSLVYLTDFYKIINGSVVISDDQNEKLLKCFVHAYYFLVQTQEIQKLLSKRSIFNKNNYFFLPPIIPNNLPMVTNSSTTKIKIGYAGKIAPMWGVKELLDWYEILSNQGYQLELHIVANKFSDKSFVFDPGFSSYIKSQISNLNVKLYSDFNRNQAMTCMSKMDFVWCFRPQSLEDHTLELSTKLVEMVASGARCLCYPSHINTELLGKSYPFFIKNLSDFSNALKKQDSSVPIETQIAINHNHSLSTVASRFSSSFPLEAKNCTVTFAGHDFKFIDSFMSYLKKLGYKIFKDQWSWGDSLNVEFSAQLNRQTDVIFCEWGLANAVWYSHNKNKDSKLIVRIHLQEVNNARKLASKIDYNNVDLFIFVSEHVRDKAVSLFGWPISKTLCIPNFVLDDEYTILSKPKSDSIHLGMVGVIPQRKRFDLAVNTLHLLIKAGFSARLFVKGPRPESLPFMHAPNRIHELDYFYDIYRRIESSSLLRDNVHFDPWGNDVALWYSKIHYILSPSDFESFHYALADGVLSGCYPLMWPWHYSSEIYCPEWVVNDEPAAINKILEFESRSDEEKVQILTQNRQLVVNKYGYRRIFEELRRTIF